jgi:hypothetical protein
MAQGDNPRNTIMKAFKFTLALLILCAWGSMSSADEAKTQNQAPNTERIAIYVDGMTGGEGIGCLGCPNELLQALTAIQEITILSVTLSEDRFDISYVGGEPILKQIHKAIQDKGFPSEVMNEDPIDVIDSDSTWYNVNRMPKSSKATIDLSFMLNRPVLVLLHDSREEDSKKALETTFDHIAVRDELELWCVDRIDIAENPEAATFYNVDTYPVAFALTPEAKLMDRFDDIAKPETFVKALNLTRNTGM